jgi:cytosine/adenosine deaminase-related metal-dependent hydrolase
MILRAKWIVPVAMPPIENGAVAMDGGTITAVGPADELTGGEVRDLGEVVLAPGLINAHCHLDYTGFVNQVAWNGSFLEWILRLVALRRDHAESQYVADISVGMNQLLQSGTTTVVNIESFPTVIDQFTETPLRIVWCLELLDVNRLGEAGRIVDDAVNFITARQGRGEFGLSPHAPYTVSAELYRQAARQARGRHWLLTTHLAESEEEEDMFRRGIGRLHDYFQRAGRDMSDCKRVGSVQLLHECEVLTPGCLVAHANCLTAADVKLLAETGTHVVHCPRSHHFFDRPTPPLELLLHAGVNVCLGTDSLASNDRLDMLAEMQELARVFPHWSPQQILTLATVNAAKALNRGNKLGKIAPGAVADLMAVPLEGTVVDPYEAVVFAEKPVCFSMIGGKVVLE